MMDILGEAQQAANKHTGLTPKQQARIKYWDEFVATVGTFGPMREAKENQDG